MIKSRLFLTRAGTTTSTMTEESKEAQDYRGIPPYEEHELPKWRPDSCWSWVVCAASGISVGIVAGVNYSFGLLLPPLMENFEETREATAWIGALYLASGSLFSPICSFISDRFSYRFTAMLGSLATIIGYSLASMSSEIWMMYLTYGLLSGFGHIMIYNSSFMVILQYFVKWRSLAVGIVASAPAIGMLMTQLTQALLSAFGWRWALRAIALLHFLCSLCSTVFVPIDKLKGEICENKSSGRQRETPQSTLLRNRSFWILLTSLFVVYLSYYVPTVHIVKHCKQELHISGIKSSMLFTYFAITSFCSRHLFCKLGDLRYFNRFHLYQGGMTISGLCVLCLPLARSFNSIVVIFLVFGLMDGALNGQFSLMVLECVGKHKVNQAWGYIMFVSGFSVGIGPPYAGLMADKLGSYAATFYTAGAVLIAGASIISLMAFAKQKREEFVRMELNDDEELLVTEKLTVL